MPRDVDQELTKWFSGEYGAEAGLRSPLGAMLERARIEMGTSSSMPSDLPPSCVRMGIDMESNLVEEALARLALPPPKRGPMLSDRIEAEAQAAKQSYAVLAAYYSPPIPYEFETVLAHQADVTVEAVQRLYRGTGWAPRTTEECDSQQFVKARIDRALGVLGWPRPPKAPVNFTRELAGQNAKIKPIKVRAVDGPMPKALGAFDRIASMHGLLVERSGKIQTSTASLLGEKWLAARAQEDLEAYRAAVKLSGDEAAERRAKMYAEAEACKASGVALMIRRAKALERVLAHAADAHGRPDTEGALLERWNRAPTAEEMRAALRALCALASPGVKADEGRNEARLQLGAVLAECRWRWQWDRSRYIAARTDVAKAHSPKAKQKSLVAALELELDG